MLSWHENQIPCQANVKSRFKDSQNSREQKSFSSIKDQTAAVGQLGLLWGRYPPALAAVEGGDSFSAHACVPASGLHRDPWHVEACREWPKSGLPFGLSGVKVGDDSWKDRRVGEGLKHCDNHLNNFSH